MELLRPPLKLSFIHKKVKRRFLGYPTFKITDQMITDFKKILNTDQVKDEYRSNEGWFLDCVLSSSTGGKINIQVSAGVEKRVWLIFWEIVNDFMGTFINKKVSARYFSFSPKCSFAGMVKQKENLQNGKETYFDKRLLADTSPFWVRKEIEVLDLHLDLSSVVTRLMPHHSREEVKEVLEEYFQSRVVINPFMDGKAMFKCERNFSGIAIPGKWLNYGNLFLKQ